MYRAKMAPTPGEQGDCKPHDEAVPRCDGSLRSVPSESTCSGFTAQSFLAEATNMAMPFKVLLAARYLGTERLAIVLAVEQCVALFLQVPVGDWADRFGRKKCVVAGHLTVVLGWLLVPAASWLHGLDRWGLVALAFALLGAGTALITGIQEAWAVDNLRTACVRIWSVVTSDATASGPRPAALWRTC